MLSLRHRDLQQSLKIRDTQPRDGIPPFRRIQRRIRDIAPSHDGRTRLAIHTITSDGLTTRDVGESLLELIEPGVEEAQGGFPRAETGVVEQGDDAAEDGAGG